MNMREILDMHPLPDGYYYKVDHNSDWYLEKTVMVMQSRAKWFDKKVASFNWRKEYTDYDYGANRRDLNEFLNTTVPVLDMRPRKDKVVPMSATSYYINDVYTSAKYNPCRVDTMRALR